MRKAFPILVVLVSITLLAAACSGSPAPAPTTGTGAPAAPTASNPYPVATAAKPAASPTAAAPAAAPTTAATANPYPVGPDGKALVAVRCVVCHPLSRVESARHSQADWLATVNRMKGNGANLNDAETQAVVAYLAATFK